MTGRLNDSKGSILPFSWLTTVSRSVARSWSNVSMGARIACKSCLTAWTRSTVRAALLFARARCVSAPASHALALPLSGESPPGLLACSLASRGGHRLALQPSVLQRKSWSFSSASTRAAVAVLNLSMRSKTALASCSPLASCR